MIIDEDLLDFFFELTNEATQIIFENIEKVTNWSCGENYIEDLVKSVKAKAKKCQSVVLSASSTGPVCNACE